MHSLTGAARLPRTIRNPFRLPRPAVISFSGGRTSSFRVANRTGPDGRACQDMKRIRLGETYAELKAAALVHRDLFDEAAASSGESAKSDSLDCHCTD